MSHGSDYSRVKLWHAAHPERVREYKRKYRERNRQKIRDAAKSTWQRDYARNHEKILARKTAYRVANPHKRAATQQAREAGKLQATPAWADKASILKIYERAHALKAQVDHTVPLRSKFVCGLHWECNLQILTKAENLAKSNTVWPDI